MLFRLQARVRPRVEPRPFDGSGRCLVIKIVAVGLSLGGKFFGVAPGAYVIGRDAACEFAIDHASVSRRHALLTVRRDGAAIEDLGSRNGVVVDGSPVVGCYELKDGSRIRIGTQELKVILGHDGRLGFAETPPAGSKRFREGEGPEQRFLAETVAFETRKRGPQPEELAPLSARAEAALAAGRSDEAERILSNHLAEVLTSLRTGFGVDGHVAKTSATLAVSLAQATHNPLWIDYVFDLYTLLDVLMPREIVDGLLPLVDRVGPIDLLATGTYVDRMTQSKADMDLREVAQLERVTQLHELAVRARGAAKTTR